MYQIHNDQNRKIKNIIQLHGEKRTRLVRLERVKRLER